MWFPEAGRCYGEFAEHVREAGGDPGRVKVPFDDLLELVHDIEDGLQATDLNVLEIPR